MVAQVYLNRMRQKYYLSCVICLELGVRLSKDISASGKKMLFRTPELLVNF
ncbi:hypothetical protein AVDCRST_MAG92-4970 [uncultured Coleofasciculus sp.]|uniref:Uncharacterized protein n=1 Tax=uncultured Coleofasciculus sp. TaxID=1267456 RepID=A0A6J4K8W3_9CYAN|nr:hypothetical protein AVDCRST_MAG92-4970 [uncultured Coleofasciculus sp.]